MPATIPVSRDIPRYEPLAWKIRKRLLKRLSPPIVTWLSRAKYRITNGFRDPFCLPGKAVRADLANYKQRPLLGLEENPADIFADDAETQQLNGQNRLIRIAVEVQPATTFRNSQEKMI